MSTNVLCLIVGVLVPLFVRSNDPPPLPHTGKLSKHSLTNGNQVSTVDDSSSLHSVHMTGQIGLYCDYGINNYEGIYTCVIPDEYNVNQTLIIALYKEYKLENKQ